MDLERTASSITRLQSLNISLHLLYAKSHAIPWSQVRPQKPLRQVLLRIIAGDLAAV